MGYKTQLKNEIIKNSLEVDIDKIISAYDIAAKHHEKQYRKSGESYISHPVEVAKLIINMKMDTDTIIAAILHDTIEDTDISEETIKKLFGEKVLKLILGVTKLKKLPEGTKKQHENVRKMIVAMAEDIRVVVIKLVDRLHNMRTLKHMPIHKQETISKETLEIYAPLAHRIGMAKIKWELEDLSFSYLNPKIYKSIVEKVNLKRKERETYTEKVIMGLKELLVKNNIEGKVSGRVKHFYSIYKKMVEKNKNFDELYDLTALRVIVDSEKNCYNLLGILHNKWKPVPGRFKDYIAVPKANGYQSIHTTIVGPQGKFIEVQIRTSDQNVIAEEGVAAHWNYKEKYKYSKKSDNVYSWLRKILEWQNDTDDSEEFVKTVTGDIFNETVFTFSPKGDVIELKLGSTPLDFAFHIHTQIGYKCIGSKVNERIVTLDYKLKNGDKVEIITSKSAKGPGSDWLGIVATQSAKSKIKKWLKDAKYDDNVKEGQEIIEKHISKFGKIYKDFAEDQIVKNYIEKHKIKDIKEFLYLIADGKIKGDIFVEKMYHSEKEITLEDVVEKKLKVKSRKKNDYGIVVEGIENTVIRFAKCCTPLPGDDIKGYVTSGSGIVIHRSDCKNYQNMFKNSPEKEISVKWDEKTENMYINKYSFTFNVIVVDRENILMELIKLISDNKIAVTGVNSYDININNNHYVNIKFIIKINDKNSYKKLINQMLKIKDVIEIRR